jgi:bifunctional ADP-heptose synthase (sugar kinase/adenylyltransferase)
VTFYAETDASALVKKLKPDLVARGRDTNEKTVPERAAAEEAKTQLAIVGDGKLYSTKDVLETFRKRSAARAARES